MGRQVSKALRVRKVNPDLKDCKVRRVTRAIQAPMAHKVRQDQRGRKGQLVHKDHRVSLDRKDRKGRKVIREQWGLRVRPEYKDRKVRLATLDRKGRKEQEV